MPDWFVRACNRTVGAYILDLMLLGVLAGFCCVVAGSAYNAPSLRLVGYFLIVPVPLLMIMMVITAQYRLWKSSSGPDGGKPGDRPGLPSPGCDKVPEEPRP